MAKAPGINLNNRTLGMSSDEYSGGSFLYGENINISRNSKGFSLSDKITDVDVSSGNEECVAMVGPYTSGTVAAIYNNGLIMSDTIYNNTYASKTNGGAIYKRMAAGYRNAIKVGNYTLGIGVDYVDLFTGDILGTSLFDYTANIVTNYQITSDTGRTVGAGWTTSGIGAGHSSGTATLTQTLTVTNARQYRVAVRCIPATGTIVGSCVISLGGTTIGTINSSSDLWTVGTKTTASTSEALTFTPSTDFNGIIQSVSVCLYTTSVEENKIAITSNNTHPTLHVGSSIYIGSGSSLDVITIGSWAIDTISLIDSTYTIIGLQQVGQNVVIFATDGENSKTYYRDRVSDAPNETILWNDKVITGVSSDSTTTYVLCEQTNTKELYAVSGYDRVLIASGKSLYSTFGNNKDYSRLYQRYDFNNTVGRSNAMGFIGNKLMIPSYNGIYTFGYENPRGSNAIVKEFIIDTSAISALANISGTTYIAYKKLSAPVVNRISQIVRYFNTTTGYLVTNPLVWDNFSSKKAMNRFRIGYILPEPTSSIDIYASVNNNYFVTFTVSGITTAPVQGDIYSNNTNTYEVISTSITGGVGTVSCKANILLNTNTYSSFTLTKVSGTGQSSITFSDSNNFIKLKTIACTKYTYGEELIFGQEFLSAYVPDWHTFQIKLVLNSTTDTGTPIIMDIPILAELTGQNG